MIHSLNGVVRGQRGNMLFLEQNGIEWALEVSQQTMQHLALKENKVRVFTYLHHKQDTMQLFGFSSEEERDVFLRLIKISGIGPKQALKILSGLSADQFIHVIEAEEIDRLSTVPGVGKKTAGKIILALRGKILTSAQQKSEEVFPELLDALSDMGFDRKKARLALQEVAKNIGSDTLSPNEYEHELFRRTIVHLSSAG